MQSLVVVAYIGSLFFGAVVYAAYVDISQGAEAIDEIGLVLYLAAYVGAVIGVGILFLSTKLIEGDDPTTPFAE